MWIKADRLHTLIPRTTDRWKATYRTRVTVEREFESLKHEWGMLPLRVLRLPRVRLHVELTILARLASALIKVRAVPLAALSRLSLSPPTAGHSACLDSENEPSAATHLRVLGLTRAVAGKTEVRQVQEHPA